MLRSCFQYSIRELRQFPSNSNFFNIWWCADVDDTSDWSGLKIVSHDIRNSNVFYRISKWLMKSQMMTKKIMEKSMQMLKHPESLCPLVQRGVFTRFWFFFLFIFEYKVWTDHIFWTDPPFLWCKFKCSFPFISELLFLNTLYNSWLSKFHPTFCEMFRFNYTMYILKLIFRRLILVFLSKVV